MAESKRDSYPETARGISRWVTLLGVALIVVVLLVVVMMMSGGGMAGGMPH